MNFQNHALICACKNCGKQPLIVGDGPFYLSCTGCPAVTWGHKTQASAVNAWNDYNTDRSAKVVWLSEYEDGSVVLHASRAEAEKAESKGRVKCRRFVEAPD